MKISWLVLLALLASTAMPAQTPTPFSAVPFSADLRLLTETQAVSGFEGPLMDKVEAALAPLHPKRDAMGNVTVTLGSGAPHRLIAAAVDEPGFVVSRIDPDGYLRVQQLPQTGLPPHYREMQNAQPMVLMTRDGKPLSAVVAGASIHLTPGRSSVPDPDDLDNMYIDMGARSADAVRRSGVDVLSPLAAERSLLRVGAHAWAGTAVGDRYGAAVLLGLARSLQGAKVQGTVTLAFVTQQWSGSRGLTRVLQQLHPDEVVYVGRGRKDPRVTAAAGPGLGSGALRYSSGASWDGFADLHAAPAADFLQRGYGPAAVLPAHAAHLGVPVLYPLTAGEMVDERDLQALSHALLKHVGSDHAMATDPPATPMAFPAVPPRPSAEPPVLEILKTLTLAYGVSEQETMSREAVARTLPAWAKTETDAAGNLILRLGRGTEPGIVFMAHTDELGFRVRSIRADGMLELDNKGGGSPAFYWGHPALVHTAAGSVASVVGLPDSFDTKDFHFPSDFRVAATLNVGAANPGEVAALGIKVGDTVTIPKRFRTLADGRVSIRSLDDRVGCAALVRAIWALGEHSTRNVTFVFSTQEELGLLGAVAYAEAAEKAGRTPSTVFAIDTFVSSDSPLESHRFANATLGDGFVIRAIDNSNIVPTAAVQRVQALARSHNIPVQYGVTGGGNDGAAFGRFGATDVTLSWPLRYSHSPAEVVDMRDVQALADITTALAREW